MWGCPSPRRHTPMQVSRRAAVELLALGEQVDLTLVERKALEAQEVKVRLEALAAASSFHIGDLFGGRKGAKKPGRA